MAYIGYGSSEQEAEGSEEGAGGREDLVSEEDGMDDDLEVQFMYLNGVGARANYVKGRN